MSLENLIIWGQPIAELISSWEKLIVSSNITTVFMIRRTLTIRVASSVVTCPFMLGIYLFFYFKKRNKKMQIKKKLRKFKK